MKKISLFKSKNQLSGLFFIGLAISAVALVSGCSDKKTTMDSLSSAKLSATTFRNLPGGPVTVSVMATGAVGNGTTDDTQAFQKAIDSVNIMGGGTVTVPAHTYLINPDVSINMRSNVTLNMVDTTRILKSKATAVSGDPHYYVIHMVNVSSATVIGGKIIGDRSIHSGTTGEHGFGIGISGCWRGNVTGTHIVNCWGDGVIVSKQTNNSLDCVLTNVVCDNNRRQGLTIAGADSLIVTGCTFTHTNGTAPQDGIDLEPDNSNANTGVHITNCTIAYNVGNGVEMNAKRNLTDTAVIKHIYVQNNYIHHNNFSGYVQYVSYVNFTNNRMINNHYNSVHFDANDTYSVFNPNTYL